MIDYLLKKIVGGHSKRYRFMIIYLIIFVLLSLTNTLNPVSFATFSGLYGLWLGLETARKGED